MNIYFFGGEDEEFRLFNEFYYSVCVLSVIGM